MKKIIFEKLYPLNRLTLLKSGFTIVTIYLKPFEKDLHYRPFPDCYSEFHVITSALYYAYAGGR